MSGVDAALQGLQPVALLAVLGDQTVTVRDLGPLEARRRRLPVGRAHVSPDHAPHLNDGIGDSLYLGMVIAVLRFIHHVRAATGNIELPAVVNAAKSVLFVSAEEKRGTTVGAELFDQADLPGCIAECHKILSQQADAHRGTVWFRQFVA